LASEAKDQRERVVDCAQLTGLEAPGRSAEPLGVDHGGLLDKDPRLLPPEADRRSKASRPGARGSRRDKRRAEVEELVGLYNNGVAGAALLAPACTAGGRQSEDLAS
jgi:hypothetical protein